MQHPAIMLTFAWLKIKKKEQSHIKHWGDCWKHKALCKTGANWRLRHLTLKRISVQVVETTCVLPTTYNRHSFQKALLIEPDKLRRGPHKSGFNCFVWGRFLNSPFLNVFCPHIRFGRLLPSTCKRLKTIKTLLCSDLSNVVTTIVFENFALGRLL